MLEAILCTVVSNGLRISYKHVSTMLHGRQQGAGFESELRRNVRQIKQISRVAR